MPSLNTISADKLARLIGRPDAPALIDVCTDEDFACDPRLVPGALRRPFRDVDGWAAEFAGTGRPAVVICQKGLKLSQGVAAWLRHLGVPAEALEGGALGWAAAGLPMVPVAVLPPRDARGRTVWVTRARPKVDRIACPWLIRRFVDPRAVFLFVNPSDVDGVAERFGAAPFDIEGEGVFWSHRGERCTFDVMVEEFGLGGFEALRRLATIVRSADTAGPISPRKRPACSRPRSGCRGCTPTTSHSSRREWAFTTPFTAGAGTPGTRPTTGRPAWPEPPRK
jgi:rhodanese-related sulfurtransferase